MVVNLTFRHCFGKYYSISITVKYSRQKIKADFSPFHTLQFHRPFPFEDCKSRDYAHDLLVGDL